MACGSCGTGGCSTGGCSTGCGKLDVHDWLGDMSRPLSSFDAVEVRFKGGRKEFYRNVNNLELFTGDIIVVESQPGHHVGEVTMQGEMVRLQMKKKNITYNEDLSIIYRKATQKDVEKFEQARNRELTSMYRTRELIREQSLQMKLSDVEFQADNSKATFFYSAEERVDFRELIKIIANEFKIRVEMKQISLRQEAGRLGGIGSCGRELCCSNWLTEFKNVNTSAARYQNLSLNPIKLSGQCGRLKCCLNYELETYISAVKDIPDLKGPLKTQDGVVFLQKTDIFKRIMWFAYPKDNNWISISVDRVNEIIELNKQGIEVFTLLQDEEEIDLDDQEINSDLLALDRKLKKKSGEKIRATKPKKQKDNHSTPRENTPQSSSNIPKQSTNTRFQVRKNISETPESSSNDSNIQTTSNSPIRKRENFDSKNTPKPQERKETPKVETKPATEVESPKKFIPKRENQTSSPTIRKRENFNVSAPVENKVEPVKEKIEKKEPTQNDDASAPKIRKRQNVQNNDNEA
jgi:cell fate regulator YaaT (PSP1 superfamily)